MQMLKWGNIQDEYIHSIVQNYKQWKIENNYFIDHERISRILPWFKIFF